MQLREQLGKFASRPNTISFSTGNALSQRRGGLAELDEGLNICTATLALLRDRLDKIARKRQNARGTGQQGFFASILGRSAADERTARDAAVPSAALLEHCTLVLAYLEALNGRVTEAVEAHRQKQRTRDKFLHASTTIRAARIPATKAPPASAIPASAIPESATQQQATLQVENNQMVEEMASDLLRSLATTEAQVLELARLQASLQSHLHAQHLAVARIFDESEHSTEDTRTGNEHLRRTAKDSSFGRRVFVFVVLLLTAVLLLLHHLRQ